MRSFPVLRYLRLMALAAALLVPSYAYAQDITTGLVGHWKLDETTGTTAVDSAGSYNGTMAGGLNAANDSAGGKVSAALEFDGTDDEIAMAGFPGLGAPLSFSAWIKPDNASTTSKSAYAIRGDDTNFYIKWDSNFGPAETLGFFSTTGANVNASIGTITPGQWHHIVGTYDGTTLRAYNNGVQVDTSASTLTPRSTGSPTANIGEDFGGAIDDVRVYNRVLSVEDIAVLASGSAPGAIRYNDETEAVEYHSGYEWVHAGHGSYSANGVTFDGSDYLQTGITLSDSKKATGSFWFRFNSSTPPGSNERILRNSINRWRISRSSSNQIDIEGENTSATDVLDFRSSALNDTNWHHVMFSFDLSDTSKRHIYVDGVSDMSVSTYTDDLIDFSATSTTVGASTNGGNEFDGDIADFWLDHGTYIDLSDANNRRRFISDNGMPMYLGPDGSLPLGRSPDIFLSGPTDDWHTNKGTGGGFTENGALTDATSQPIARNSTITVLDSATGAGNSSSIHVAGNTLFESTSANHTVRVWDVSDPSSLPAALDSIGTSGAGYGNPNTIAATEDGNYVFIMGSTADYFTVINATDKSNLSIGSSITGNFNGGGDIDVIGDTAYTVGSTDDDFAIVDISTPTSPSVTGFVSSGTQLNGAGDLHVVGDYAYVASSVGDSITIIDISSPASPSITGYLSDGTNLDGAGAIQATSDGNYAFVGVDDATGGFAVVDTSTKASPSFVARYNNTAINTREILLDETHSRLFVLGNNDVLEVWDVGTPSNPVFLNARTDTPNFDAPRGLDYLNQVVFVSGNDSDRIVTLEITNCTSPAAPIGSIIYNTDDKVMQYCNGVDWVAMGPVGGTGGGGCASPAGSAGDLMFNEDHSVLQFCNSEDWVGIGRPDTVPTAGLVGHWTLDETSGTTAADSSGYGNDGTMSGGLSGTDSVAGKVSTALNFDGTDGTLIQANGPEITNLSLMTACAWFNLDSLTNADGDSSLYLLSKGPQLRITDLSGTPHIDFHVRTSGVYPKVESSTVISTGQWYHVCAVHNGPSVQPDLYLNGIEEGTSEVSSSSSQDDDSGLNLRIGGFSFNSTSGNFPGTIDDVRIYNRALSASEVRNLYEATR